MAIRVWAAPQRRLKISHLTRPVSFACIVRQRLLSTPLFSTNHTSLTPETLVKTVSGRWNPCIHSSSSWLIRKSGDKKSTSKRKKHGHCIGHLKAAPLHQQQRQPWLHAWCPQSGCPLSRRPPRWARCVHQPEWRHTWSRGHAGPLPRFRRHA